MVITKGWNPTRQFRLLEERATRIRENKATLQAIEEQLTQTGHTKIPSGPQGVDQNSSPFLGEDKDTRQKQDLFQAKAERVRPNNPEAFGIGERSTKEPEIVVNTSRISSPNDRNITPTKNEHSVVTPESNLNSDILWLQMSQYSEETQKQFAELQESHERMKTLTAYMEQIMKALQEGHAQLSKASEETNKRLNEVFEEQHHCKRDRDLMDQDLNKLFNVYQNMKPQPQGHVLDNPYHQGDIKPVDLFGEEGKVSISIPRLREHVLF
ncbi:hypothetical protein O181_052960 [Austropuccinia psidii MF-1]|uniref:Uncharacterized protein n=1 Tax=Austropuccinia psidii MF-1 TaxID=1389203 RepID=A0A9Q3E5Y9_9BASI|nr:hypothetical protein [Austropuccinia psidii MF-1]